MLTGKTFKLDRPTMAFITDNGRQHSIIVPKGAIVEVVTHARNMTDILWDGQALTMFMTI